MDVLVKITVPNYIYRFYSKASQHVANCSAEELMADALSAYAGLLSRDISKKRSQSALEAEAHSSEESALPLGNSSASRSR